jgi:hypothetical protein
MKAFVWKRVVLDMENGGQVAKSDLKALDPNWKGKTVIWKSIFENDLFTLEMCQELFADKTKPKEVVEVKVDLDKPKTYFPAEKQ